MTDEKTEPIQPITVTLIGTGDGAANPLMTGDIAKTADHLPNLVVRVIAPVVALAVRFGYEWCVSFSGSMLAAGITTKVLPHSDFMSLLESGAFLATCIAGIGFVKNAATVFSGLEKKFPLSTGSI